MIKLTLRLSSPALAAVLSIEFAATAQTTPKAVPNINIENFGQMDEHYYRGAQPKIEDLSLW